MKKWYICTIVCSSGKDRVLIILFQLYGSKAELFESNFFWVGHLPANLHIGRTANPILI